MAMASAKSSGTCRETNAQVRRELSELHNSPNVGFILKFDQGNILKWYVQFFGAPGTPYQGCYLKATMKFPRTYPREPPTVNIQKLINEEGKPVLLFHPNIYEGTGELCMSVLNNGQGFTYSDLPYQQEMWRTSHTAGSIIRSMTDVLGNPNPETPANPTAGNMYRRDRQKFYSKVDEYKVVSAYQAQKDNIRIPLTCEDYEDPSTYVIEDDEDHVVVTL